MPHDFIIVAYIYLKGNIKMCVFECELTQRMCMKIMELAIVCLHCFSVGSILFGRNDGFSTHNNNILFTRDMTAANSTPTKKKAHKIYA